MKNTFVKVLSFVMALTMIVGAFGAITVSAAECTHEGAEIIGGAEASCNSIGYNKYLCPTCGEEYIDDIVPSKGDHDYKKVDAIPATCTSNAISAGEVCKKCNQPNPANKPAEVPNSKLPHTPGDFWVTVPHTCTEDGYKTKQCLVCLNPINEAAYKDTTYEDKAGHEYIYTVVTAATKCIPGKVVINCAKCDLNDVLVQAAGHEWVDMKTVADSATEIVNKGLVADINGACGYTWKSGKYCKNCFETTDTVPNSNPTHGGSKVTAIDLDNLNEQLSNMTIPGTNEKFTINSVTSGKATCKATGWELWKCTEANCGRYWIKTTPKLTTAHATYGAWSDWTGVDADGNTVTLKEADYANKAAIEKSKYHNISFTRTKKCNYCDHVVSETTTLSSHNFTKKGNVEYTFVYAVTCTDNGYTYKKCNVEGCTYEETTLDAVATGLHSWQVEGANPVYVKVKDYNCEDLAKSKVVTTCTNPWCDTDQKPNDTTKTAATDTKDDDVSAHTWTHNDVVAGTCMVASHYQDKCSYCNATRAYYDGAADKDAFADYAASATDPSNHVAKNGAAGTYIAIGNVKQEKVYCTDAEVTYYVCKCGVRIDVTTKPAKTSHKFITGGETEDGGDIPAKFGAHVAGCDTSTGVCAEGCTYVNFEPVAATCVATGMSAGTICVDCGYIPAGGQPTVEAINPDLHTGNKITSTIKTVAATCKAGEAGYGYTSYNCADCYDLVTEYTKTGTTIQNDPKNHTNVLHVDAKAAYCIYKGNVEYVSCKDCNKTFKLDTEVTGRITNTDGRITAFKADPAKADAMTAIQTAAPKTAHTWSAKASTKNVSKVETCTADGIYDFEYCTLCQNGEDLFDAAADLKTVKVVRVNGQIKEDVAATEDVNEAYNAIVIKKHELAYTKNWSYLNGKATCTTSAWVGIPNSAVCLYCYLGADRASGLAAPQGTASSAYWVKAFAHKNGSVPAYKVVHTVNYKLNAADEIIGVEDCLKPSFQKAECTLCKDIILVNYENARATEGKHTYEVDADGNYTKVVPTTATCIVEGGKYVKCEKCDYKNVLESTGYAAHKLATGTEISFACKDFASYQGLTCADCHKTVGLKTLVHNPVKSEKAVTCTEDGWEIIYCADCNLDFDGAKAIYYPHTGHDAGVADKDKVVVSETAAETVYRCKGCGETYPVAKPVPFNATVTYSANTVVAGDKVDVVVTVSGKAVNYNTALVTLDIDDSLFVIDSVKAGDAKAIAVPNGSNIAVFVPNTADGVAQNATVAADGSVVVTVTLQAKRNANGSDKVEASVVFNNKAELTADAVTQETELVVTGFGNLNGDAYYTVEDAIAVFDYINKDYNAAADVNGDGQVDLDDAMAVAKYAASAKTAADYLIMIGEYEKIEAYVAELFTNGLVPDLDGDRAILINDVYVLLNKIDTELAAATFNYSTVEELVDYVIAH